MTVVYILPDADTECGGILTASTGEIQTQDRNNDGKYEAYTDCPWAIIAQNNSLIELQFHNFSLEYEPLCSFDFLEVCFYIFLFYVIWFRLVNHALGLPYRMTFCRAIVLAAQIQISKTIRKRIAPTIAGLVMQTCCFLHGSDTADLITFLPVLPAPRAQNYNCSLQ